MPDKQPSPNSTEVGAPPGRSDAAPEPAAAKRSGAGRGGKGGFTPPNFLEALRQASPIRKGGGSSSGGGSAGRQAAGGSWWSRLKESQARAQPATGTEEDRIRVTYLDRRELIIGWSLSAFMVALSLFFYFSAVHYSNKKSAKLTSEFHHAAPEVLIVGLLLAALQAGATASKRRALLGFALLLGGLGLFSLGSTPFGLVYFGVGIWMIFRALRRPRPALAGAGTTTTTARAAGRTAGSSRTNGGKGAPTPARPRPTPSASKRYTPPKPPPKSSSRTKKPAPALAQTADTGSGGRLGGFLRRRRAGA